MSIIDKNTKISIELVIVLMGLATSTGILYNKIENLENRMARFEQEHTATAQIVDSADSTKMAYTTAH